MHQSDCDTCMVIFIGLIDSTEFPTTAVVHMQFLNEQIQQVSYLPQSRRKVHVVVNNAVMSDRRC